MGDELREKIAEIIDESQSDAFVGTSRFDSLHFADKIFALIQQHRITSAEMLIEILAPESYAAAHDDVRDYISFADSFIHLAEALNEQLEQEQFCEWTETKEPLKYSSNCGIATPYPVSLKIFKFCPFCGKKIRIVEGVKG